MRKKTKPKLDNKIFRRTAAHSKKINIDPAVASGPLITTINDLVAVVTYYGLSWVLLLEVLHMAG